MRALHVGKLVSKVLSSGFIITGKLTGFFMAGDGESIRGERFSPTATKQSGRDTKGPLRQSATLGRRLQGGFGVKQSLPDTAASHD